MTATEPSPPPPPRMAWHAPALADRTSWPWAHVAVVTVLLTAGALLDAGLMQPAIMTVLRNSPDLAAVVAFVAAAMATAAAGWAGWCWAGARGNHPEQAARLAWPLLLLLGWALLGAAIYKLRLAAANTATQAAYAGTTTDQTGAHERTAAAVFLVVYILVGLFAFVDLRHLRNDAFTTRLKALRDLTRAQSAKETAEAELRRLADNVGIRQTTLTDLDNQEQLALTANHAFADELKDLARVLQAIGLQDVTKTGITQARQQGFADPTPRQGDNHDDH